VTGILLHLKEHINLLKHYSICVNYMYLKHCVGRWVGQ